MVRYARAKGSKASNERCFEEATSWSEMRQQLTDAQRRAQSKANKVRHEVDVDVNENEPVETSWAVFDVPSCKNQMKQFPNTYMKSNETIKRKKKKQNPDNSEHFHSYEEDRSNGENYEDVSQEKKKKKNKVNSVLTSEESVTEEECAKRMSKPKKNKMICSEDQNNFHPMEFSDTHVRSDETIKKKKKKLNPGCSEQSHLPKDDRTIGENYKDMSQEKKKKMKNKIDSVVTYEESVTEEEYAESMPKQKKNKIPVCSEDECNFHTMEISDTHVRSEETIKRKKKKLNPDSSEQSDTPKDRTIGENDENVSQEKKEKKKKNKTNSVLTNEENATQEEYNNTIPKQKFKNKQSKNKMQIYSEDVSSSQCSISGLEMDCSKGSEEVGNDKIEDKRELMYISINIDKKKSTRLQKEKADLPISRRKGPTRDLAQTLHIGGRTVEICVFDGFPVLKEDWERLDTLKKKMVEQNIPQDEMKAQLQILRRRAEKSLARTKKKVCLRCRQQGHSLADCPTNRNDLIETVHSDICFKCGSTEHSYLTCKVVKNDSFRFASCFVCGEQGHIARQCPDNPRGVYPSGGACKICGDVTHLKKDCPQHQEIQQKSTVTLQTLSSNNSLEGLETDIKKTIPLLPQQYKKKIVKF